MKLVLKTFRVNNWKPAFKDHLKQFISVIRFNDNRLKAIVLSKDVDVVKFLVSQKFFLLEGVSLTRERGDGYSIVKGLTKIRKQESQSNIHLQRVQFLFESYGDKKADLGIE